MFLPALHRFFYPERTVVARPEYDTLISRLFQRLQKGECTVVRNFRNEVIYIPFEGQAFFLKKFVRPKFLNRIIYGNLRSSKAQRSYEHAQWLIAHGLHTPEPIAWHEERPWFLFRDSYYLSRASVCPYTMGNLVEAEGSPRSYEGDDEPIIRAMATMAARLHKAHAIHMDFSRNNILFRPVMPGDPPGTEVLIELVDLNRIRIGFHISIEQGLKNLRDCMTYSPRQWAIAEETYRELRNKK